MSGLPYHRAVASRPPALPREGFTIVELLVVIGVLALLIALLAPALRAMKTAGRQNNEMSAARQLMAGYNAYASANKDRVLPGYGDLIPNSPSDPNARVLRAYDQAGREITGAGGLDTARKRYVWRLAPYLSYSIDALYTNENRELLEEMRQQDYDSYLYLATVFPSLGLNSTWVGGDANEYGFLPGTHALRNVLDMDRFYLTALSQALHPDRLMVFASARGTDPNNPTGGVSEGYFRISSPYLSELTNYRWSLEFNPGEPPANYGHLSPRYEGSAVAAFIDGHTDTLTADQLKDMRYWSNWATTENWRLPRIDQ